MLFGFFARIGEAKVPGPSSSWALGCLNPNSLLGKAHQVAALPMGIFAVSESSLTAPGVARCQQELKRVNPEFRYLAGSPAPPRSEKSHAIGGKPVGVGFVSSFPCRSMSSGWSDLYSSSRLAAGHFFVGGHWVTGGVAYGYASNAIVQEVCDATDDLLAELTDKIVIQSTGPRFLAGDWNQEPGRLTEPKRWEQMGFIEIQDWAFQFLGLEPSVTCKGKTRKDYLYLSPELQSCLQSVHLNDELFSDHSVLFGSFASDDLGQIKNIWRMPEELPWDAQLLQATQQSSLQSLGPITDPTAGFRAACQNLEAAVELGLAGLDRPTLPAKAKGRGSTLHTRQQQQMFGPLKPSRRGEKIPQFDGLNLEHKRCFKQLRRLVNYRRLCLAPQTVATMLHSQALWAAIVRCVGFEPNFPAWWSSMKSETVPVLPSKPPDWRTVDVICNVVESHVDQLEATLIHEKITKATDARQRDANAIFRDAKQPKAVPVDTVVAKRRAIITDVHEDASFEFSPPDAFDGVHVLHTRLGAIPVVHVADGQAWLDRPADLEIGEELVHRENIGSIAEIQERFLADWNARWDRHASVSSADWAEIIAQVDDLLVDSPPCMQISCLTPDRLRHFASTRKKTAAVGLDGLSRQDLVGMPEACLQQIIDLYSWAESSGRWPTQLLQGVVHALRKHPLAETINEYRPITIFPLAYRLYSSLRAREILKHLSQHAPASIRGNRKGASSVETWWQLQWSVEFSLYQGIPLAGATLDLVKAFNLLPRDPLFRAASFLQVPAPILRSWYGFISTMSRRFSIRGSLSRGVQSSTGFPEGCGLSVCAMQLFTWVLDRWMTYRWPQITLTTYVDNLSMTAPDAQMLPACIQSTKEFATTFDMQVDDNKTMVWAVEASHRQVLRAHGLTLMHSGRELGGHVQYDHRRSGHTVRVKLDELQDLWGRLTRSRCPASQKLRAARVCAWPRAFHSISIVHLTNQEFQHQRACLMRAVHYAAAGASSIVQFSMFGKPCTDPGFWALQHTVLTFRKFCDPDIADWTLQEAHERKRNKLEPGPCGVLVVRIKAIRWTHVGGTQFVDHDGRAIDLISHPLQEVKLRLQEAWIGEVGRSVQKRKGFQGLMHADVFVTHAHCHRFNPDELGVLRIALNGAHVCANRHFADVEELKCPFCSMEDSLHHRHWECPATEASRQRLTVETLEAIPSLPECLRERGWATLPPELAEFRRLVDCTPDTSGHFAFPSSLWSTRFGIDLFPDGSVLKPAEPRTRLGTWSVSIAHWNDPDHFLTLAAGQLPGTLQTIARAEVTAIIACLQFALTTQATCRVWCDNALVCSRVKAIQAGDFAPDRMTIDGDLWHKVFQLMEAVGPRLIITKVTSHLDVQQLSQAEAWVAQGNAHADAGAEAARELIPRELVQLSYKLSAAQSKMHRITDDLQAHFVRVGMLFVLAKPHATPSTQDHQQIEQPCIVNCRELAYQLKWNCPPRLQFTGIHLVVNWLAQIEDPSEPLRFVSWHELYISCQLSTGLLGFQKRGLLNWVPQQVHAHWHFPRQAKLFGQFLQAIIRSFHPEWRSGWQRPSFCMFGAWTGGLQFRPSAWMRLEWENWLTDHLPCGYVAKVGRDLAFLPRACREDRGPPLAA